MEENLENFMNLQNQMSSSFKEDSLIQGFSFASYNTPTFKESKYKKFILRGPDNLFPNYLVKLMNDCPLHGTIVRDKAKQIAGNGFTVQDSEDKDQLALINEFLKTININKSLKRWALDQQTFGYFFIGITWNAARTKIANIYHVDASTVCVGEPNPETGEVDNFWYSENWRDYRKANFRPERIARFDPLYRVDENCLVMVREYNPATRFYGIPGYNGGRDAIELNIELTSYMLNSVKEGFAPTLNIAFNNGIPTSEERETVYRTINNLFKGAKGQRFILSFNNSKENSTEITPINVSNMSDIYARLADYVEGEILKAHKAPKILYGIPQAGKLAGGSSTNELEVCSEDFTVKVIEPARTEIESVIQDLLLINDFNLSVFIKPSKRLSSQFSDTVIMNTLTVDEIRAKQNLPPLSDSDRKNLAINITQPAVEEVTPATQEGLTAVDAIPQLAPVNDNIKNLSSKQHIQLLRIVRQYSKGQITKDMATVLLQTGLGLTQEDIDKMLPEIEDEDLSVTTPGLAPYAKQVEPKKKKE